MRQLICSTAGLFLFLFLFIFGHAVLIIKYNKVSSLTHGLYKIVYIVYTSTCLLCLAVWSTTKKRKRKRKKSYILEFYILPVLVFVVCYYYVKLVSFTLHLYFSSFFKIVLNKFISSFSIAVNKLILVFFADTFYIYLFNLCFKNYVN